MDQNPNVSRPAEGEDDGGEAPVRYSRGPRQFVKITISDITQIHYKNTEYLRQFLADSGKLRPRRQTGISAHQQRLVSQAVKRARQLALLPFDRGHVR